MIQTLRGLLPKVDHLANAFINGKGAGAAPEPEGAASQPIRFASSEARQIIDSFRGSPLLAAGKLSIVAINAIAERLGPRWPSRRELVQAHADRVLRKTTGSEALVQRVTETDYLVVQPQMPRITGQLRCIEGLREILAHFLGEATVGDLTVHEVTGLTGDGVIGRRLSPDDMRAAGAGQQTELEALAIPTLDRWTPFMTADGQRVSVSCSLEPVIHLPNSAPIGYRVASRVQRSSGFTALSADEFQRLSSHDIERIDFAVIARGVDRLRLATRAKAPSAIIPVSLVTLQTRRGRGMVYALLRQAREHVAQGLICEITGVEGAPVATLHESVSALRPFSLRVIARLRDAPSYDARHLAGVGLDGLSTRCGARTRNELIEAARAFVQMNGRIAKTFLLYQVPDLALARVAATLGVTHATLAPHRLKALQLDDEPA